MTPEHVQLSKQKDKIKENTRKSTKRLQSPNTTPEDVAKEAKAFNQDILAFGAKPN